MLDTLNAILNVNFTTALIVAALVAGSGVIFREMSNSNMLTVFFVPIAAFGALSSIYGLSQAGIFFTGNKDANAVMSSGLGMILAFTTMLIVIRLWIAIGDMRRPPDPSGRLLDTDPGT
jgi:hypothetical protein